MENKKQNKQYHAIGIYLCLLVEIETVLDVSKQLVLAVDSPHWL